MIVRIARVKVGNRQAPLQHQKPHPQKVGFLRLRRFPGSNAYSKPHCGGLLHAPTLRRGKGASIPRAVLTCRADVPTRSKEDCVTSSPSARSNQPPTQPLQLITSTQDARVRCYRTRRVDDPGPLWATCPATLGASLPTESRAMSPLPESSGGSTG